MGSVPEGTPEDVDRAVAAARAAFEVWSPDARRRARRAAARPSRRRWASASEEIAALISPRGRDADRACRMMIQAGLPAMTFASMPDLIEKTDVGGAGRQLADRARAGRRRRRDHAVELPAAPDLREGRAGAGRGLHGRRSSRARSRRSTRSCSPRSSTRSGCRPACFNLVTGLGPVVGEAIAAHPGVDMVSFTGSTRAGRRVSEVAAQTVKRVALELGGKSPNVILDDADLAGRGRRRDQQVLPELGPDVQRADAHARPARAARRGRADRRRGGRAAQASATRSSRTRRSARSSPTPSASACAATSERASRRARSSWPAARSRPRAATRATSSSRRSSPRSRPEMTIAQEEIFGPVLAIMPYDDEDEAVGSPTTPSTAWPAACGRATPSARSASRAGSAPGRSRSTAPRSTRSRRSAASSSRATAASSGKFGLEEFLEVKSIQL